MVTQAHHLRPRGSLFRQWIIAALVFMTPVFVALYVLTVPVGAWRLVVFVQVCATVVAVLASFLFFRTGLWVDPTQLRERGYFGRITTVPVSDIGTIILAKTFSGGDADSTPQLFVCDKDGRQVIRLRGQFWSREDMEIVIATLDVPHKYIDDAMSQTELRSEYPGLLYWFERRPVIAALAFTAATAVFGALVLLVVNLLGISA